MPSNTLIIGKRPVTLVIQFIMYVTNLIEFLLGIRFVLRLLGANPANGFASFIYDFSDVFLAPFSTIFPRSVVNGSVFEWSTLLAMVIYAIVSYAIIQLIIILTKDSAHVETVETMETVETVEKL